MGGLKGTCPWVQFGVNGFSVATSASTTFEGGTCSVLKNGDKVTVKGTRQADGSVAATRVTRKKVLEVLGVLGVLGVRSSC